MSFMVMTAKRLSYDDLGMGKCYPLDGTFIPCDKISRKRRDIKRTILPAGEWPSQKIFLIFSHQILQNLLEYEAENGRMSRDIAYRNG